MEGFEDDEAYDDTHEDGFSTFPNMGSSETAGTAHWATEAEWALP